MIVAGAIQILSKSESTANLLEAQKLLPEHAPNQSFTSQSLTSPKRRLSPNSMNGLTVEVPVDYSSLISFIRRKISARNHTLAFCLSYKRMFDDGHGKEFYHKLGIAYAIGFMRYLNHTRTYKPPEVESIAFCVDANVAIYIPLAETKSDTQSSIQQRWDTVKAIMTDASITKIAYDMKTQSKVLLDMGISGKLWGY
jgi:hypothetical protein